ncbi:GAP family protein [Gordonia sp. CPCC 205515]|uniref:GAP family protein n=1 Tax=Gordonia sp. CPCC 205515 TaxID=3140791 RepID=UPI003AF34E17
MGSVIGDLLPLAVGVAISPIPIIAAILMLLAKNARATSIAFAVGWLAGIVIATVIFVLVGGAVDDTAGSSGVSWIKLVLGVLLLLLGVRQWRGREDTSAPKWMAAIDTMKPLAAIGIGFALAAINPKNLMMCIGAGVAIGAGALPAGQTAVCVLIFALLAAITVLIPVIGYLVAADRLRVPLENLKEWLQAHNHAVMAVLFVVIGVMLIGKSLGGL